MDPIGYFLWNWRGNHFSISSGVIMLQKPKMYVLPARLPIIPIVRIGVTLDCHTPPANDNLLTVCFDQYLEPYRHARIATVGLLGMVPFIISPIYTLYSGIGYIGIST